MDGGHDLHQEAAPRRALHIQQPGGFSVDRDGLVGLRGSRARMRGGGCPGSRCDVSRQASKAPAYP
jgi:hypothetical protein